MFKPQPTNAPSPSQTSNAPAKPHADMGVVRKLKAKEAKAEAETEARETEVGT